MHDTGKIHPAQNFIHRALEFLMQPFLVLPGWLELAESLLTHCHWIKAKLRFYDAVPDLLQAPWTFYLKHVVGDL